MPYIPSGWWCAVRTLQPTVMVNWWTVGCAQIGLFAAHGAPIQRLNTIGHRWDPLAPAQYPEDPGASQGLCDEHLRTADLTDSRTDCHTMTPLPHSGQPHLQGGTEVGSRPGRRRNRRPIARVFGRRATEASDRNAGSTSSLGCMNQGSVLLRALIYVRIVSHLRYLRKQFTCIHAVSTGDS
jgi:hypothetical protein